MNSPAAVTSSRAEPVGSGYCEHPSARHIRMYMPYADANTLRLRAAQASGLPEAHVSWVYAIPGGWGWTICRECRVREQKLA